MVSPEPLSAAKRKSVLLPQTSCAVRDRLLPSARVRLYLADHESDILLHKAAKKAFDELGVKKLPSVKSLQEEYAKLLSEKKAAYAEYRRSRDEMRELLLHKQNVDRMLGKTSAGRRRKRSMTGNNGHAPKRFAETRSRASCAFKGVLGALPLTSRGEFSRRQKFPENAKEGPLCPACHVCFQYGGSPQQQGKAPRKLSISCAI